MECLALFDWKIAQLCQVISYFSKLVIIIGIINNCRNFDIEYFFRLYWPNFTGCLRFSFLISKLEEHSSFQQLSIFLVCHNVADHGYILLTSMFSGWHKNLDWHFWSFTFSNLIFSPIIIVSLLTFFFFFSVQVYEDFWSTQEVASVCR